ncbi:MAG: HD domain-containing protein [Deltaproteobacteria bacterium]|nr:HD domain-containing protein [Deltaproteobacteria bacterium]
MDPIDVIQNFYDKGSKSYRVLVEHSRQVADLAVNIAVRLQLSESSRTFIYEAAMLHDVGIIGTDAPKLGCFGDDPYIRHGVIGRAMLEGMGLDAHALVCERHVGLGITASEIALRKLPLPWREMAPLSLAEEIVCYADKFFSKNGNAGGVKKSPEAIEESFRRYGVESLGRFALWRQRFGEPG